MVAHDRQNMNLTRLFSNLTLLLLCGTLASVNALSQTCKISGKSYRNGAAVVELRGNTLFRCTCYITSTTKRRVHCTQIDGEAQLLVAEGGNIRKYMLGDGKGFKQNYIHGLQGIAVSVGVDYNRNYVFWSDVSSRGRGIYRASLSDIGRITNIVSKDIYEPNGLAVDWLSHNLYWTDAQLGSISVAGYTGENVVRLIGGLSEPRGIVVVPQDGIMFWGDQTKGTIERASMDGSNHRVIVVDLAWPNEIVADQAERMIYWVDGYRRTIESCDYNGNNHSVVYDFHMFFKAPAFGLALYDDRLYFGIWNTTTVYSITKIGQNIKPTVRDLGMKPMGITITNGKIQNHTDTTNACWTGDRYCSHLCLPISPTEHRCACPSNSGLVLASDRRTCILPEDFLLYTSLGDGTVMMMSMTQRASRIPTLFAQSHQPSAVDFDPIEKMVYWSDVAVNAIYRKPMNSSPSAIFLQNGIGTVDGLCIDWINRHLYFTNIGYARGGVAYHRIELVDLRDVTKRKILTSSGFGKPRDIVIDLVAGNLYVSDWGSDPKIVRLDLDGQNAKRLDIAVDNPNGLAFRNRYLYITDAHRKGALLQANGTIVYQQSPTLTAYDTLMETSEELELVQVDLELPFGLTINENKLYLTDWELGGIYEVGTRGQDASAVIVGVQKPTGIMYASTIVPDIAATACMKENQCNDICVSTDATDYVCLCSDQSGTVQSENNNWNCVPPDSFILVADGNRIVMKSLSPPDPMEKIYVVMKTFDQLSDIVAVTFDPLARYIYWADNGRGHVSRRALGAANPNRIESVYKNIGQVDSMTLDPDNRLLYWTDVAKGTIEIMDLNSMLHATVLTQLDRPRAIALDPPTGMMYWTEWGKLPMLSGSKMGGQDPRPLILNDLLIPNGLFMDQKSRKLYIADNGTMSIRSATSGSDAGLLDQIDLTGTAGYLYGLGKIDASKSLVFSDWKNGTVMQIRGYDSLEDTTEVLMKGLIRPSQLYVQNEYRFLGHVSPCQPQIHGCSHICIPNDGDYVCMCPDNLVLANDLRRCVTEEEAARFTSTIVSTTVATTTASNTQPWADRITTTVSTVAPATTNSTTVTTREATTSTAITTTAVVETTTAIPSPEFNNCPPVTETITRRLPPDSSFLVVRTLNLTAVDAEGRPINVTAVDDDENAVDHVEAIEGKHILHFRATDQFGQSTKCVVSLIVEGLPLPKFTNCPPATTTAFQAQLLADSSYLKVLPSLDKLDLKAVDGAGKPLNVTAVDDNNNPVAYVKAKLGNHIIHFRATDFFGKTATCVISLVVKDVTPPKLIDCPRDINVEAYSKKSVFVNWKSPVFEDNSGQPVAMTSTHEPGQLMNGIYEVKYLGTDNSGNSAVCTFAVAVVENTTKCNMPYEPPNSKLVCTTDQKDGMQKCLITCDKGFLLTLADPYIKCLHNKFTDLSEWLPSINNNVCQRPIVGNVRQEVHLSYPCPCQPSAKFYDTRRESFGAALKKHSSCKRRLERLSFCNNYKSKIFLQCIDQKQLNVTVTVDLAEVNHLKSTKDARRLVKRGSIDVVDMVAQGKLQALGTDEKEYKAAALDDSNSISKPLVICEKGYIMDDKGCAKCPKGTYLKDNICHFCPIDYYQHESGKEKCYKCPKEKGTASYGTMNVLNCEVKPHLLGGSSNNIVIGGVVGGVLFLLAVLFIIGFVHKRRKNNKFKKEMERKQRQKMAKERRRRKAQKAKGGSSDKDGTADRNGPKDGNANKSGSARTSVDSDRQKPDSRNASKEGKDQTVAVITGSRPRTQQQQQKQQQSAAAPAHSEAASDDLDTISRVDTDIVTQTDVSSVKTFDDDDAKSAGAESAIFTDGGASDSVSVVSSEMPPLKSALKKPRKPRPPPSFLEDDASTVISASTISVGRVKRMQQNQRPTSLDADLGGRDSMRQLRGPRRAVSMRRPESVSPSRFLPDGGPQSMPVHGMPMQRTISMERGPPGPGYDPRLMPHPNGPMMMQPHPQAGPHMGMAPGSLPIMAQPVRRRAPLYGSFAPRGMPPPQGNRPPFNPNQIRNPYMTLPPASLPVQGAPGRNGYWNEAYDGPNEWDRRNDNKMRPPMKMRTMPRSMGPRYMMPNGMRPGGPNGIMPPHFAQQRMPSPPPYYE